MPLIYRSETDMFRFFRSRLVDVMVNPVNCRGAMGAGIAKEFKDTFPAMFDEYQAKCQSDKGFHIGQIMHYYDAQSQVDIINLPTKRHYSDLSDIKDIAKGLYAFREWLELPENVLKIIAMPMLGCGHGKVGYEVALPVFEDILGSLPNNIYLSMAPDKLDGQPLYLGIVGPRKFGWYRDPDTEELNPDYEAQKAYIEAGLLGACRMWGKKPNDFRWVSGGAGGVDEIGCGDGIHPSSFERSLCAKYSDKSPIIFKPDWDRFGKPAGFLRNRNIVDTSSHLLVLKPPGIQAIGTAHSLRLAMDINDDVLKEGLGKDSVYYKHIVVKGEKKIEARINKGSAK